MGENSVKILWGNGYSQIGLKEMSAIKSALKGLKILGVS